MITAKLETITPQIAASMIGDTSHQRRLNPTTVKAYAQQMKAGEWNVNGETIILTSDGTVNDGNHRLHAIVDSGIAITTMVVRGTEKESFKTIDTGIARTGASLLEMDGVKPKAASAISGASASLILAKLRKSAGAGAAGLTKPLNIKKFADENNRIFHLADLLLKTNRVGNIATAGTILFLWFMMDRVDAYAASEFWEGVLTGADMGATDPRLVLRNRAIAMTNSQSKWTKTKTIEYISSTFWWFLNARECRHSSNMLSKASSKKYLKLIDIAFPPEIID